MECVNTALIKYLFHLIMILTSKILFQIGNRYSAIKPLKNKHIQLKEVLQLFSREELKEIIMNKIKS